MTLPTPEHPGRNWSDFLIELWAHGITEADPQTFAFYMHQCMEELEDTFWPDEDGPFARPSRGSQCPQMHFFNAIGKKREPMPGTMPATFAMGHFAHSMAYAALASAVPEGFELIIETKADVTNSIPDGAKTGSADLIIRVVDKEKASKFIPEAVLDEMPQVLCDLKTMTGKNWRDHKTKVYDDKYADAGGYLGQLSVYYNSHTLAAMREEHGPMGVYLVAVNKESPHMGLVPRFIDDEQLAKRWEHARRCYSNTEDVGPWLLDNFPKRDVGWYCGAVGRDGYCPHWRSCREHRSKDSERKDPPQELGELV